MKKVFIFLILFVSCKTTINTIKRELPTSANSLEYHFPMKEETLSIVAQEIEKVKETSDDIFLMLDTEENYFVLKIIPSDNLVEEKIGSLKVVNSNRYVDVKGTYYFLVFRIDTSFGILSKEYITHPITGEKIMIYNCPVTIYEGANSLFFDKKWNFVKKSSLINYDVMK
ncbi:hypothetical protein [Capnocytophaga sp. G2]|uniref:hypothetical protein n=1 Tax=Capnocytophaga sp. G2 TaxID=3110695 RepID=UPI002B49A720|nr:hypothetical protein [Capnocytophaga sp. G2]MEB3005803.1 hypothetical protein [Capnocytophaga sp. G2]